MHYKGDDTEWGLKILFTQEQRKSGIDLRERLECGGEEKEILLGIHKLFWSLLFTVHPWILEESQKCPISTFVMLLNMDKQGQFANCGSICGKVSGLLFVFQVVMLKEISIRLRTVSDPTEGFKYILV
jgi:hypothetical protein